ncbi:glycosyltransferase [Cryobacterium sp. PH31-O1]|uniref:glycosyltransferase n=1 Tax=Cryobacterium sp. PH31-O1 TaxID=3046306 RepID=UPI0024BB0A71|nr:glycosyltransferase [Cryobacterium sp. PH31-O1]MDJ0338356.1 glycosyltransferase [Cryobacterium sp. PH31-O1]
MPNPPDVSLTGPFQIVQIVAAISPTYGGPSISSVALHRALLKRGVNARLLSTSYQDDSGKSLTSQDALELTGRGTNIWLGTPSRPLKMKNSLKLLYRVLRDTRNANLIHIEGHYLLPNVYGYLFARLWRVPYGLQPHGALENQDHWSMSKKGIFNLLIGNAMIRHARYVAFASANEASSASSFVRADQAAIRILGAELSIPCAPVGSETNDQIDLAARVAALPRNSCFLYLGRLASVKRPDLLLRAWSKSIAANYGLLIVAGPDGSFTIDDLRQLAQSLAVEDSVVFIGPVAGPEKSWLYQHAGTFVVSSEHESFGLTICESMLAGCHVIANPEVAASVLLHEANAGDVISPMNEVTLAASLNSAFTNQLHVSQSGERARTYAQTHVTWTPMVELLTHHAHIQ